MNFYIMKCNCSWWSWCLVFHNTLIYFRDCNVSEWWQIERISSFKNCHPFVTYFCVLKYMFAAELFSFLSVVGVCLLLKVVVQMSLTQFLRRKQEVPCVKISYLQFFKLSYFVIFYQFRKDKICPAGPRWIGLYLSTLYTNTICQFWLDFNDASLRLIVGPIIVIIVK